MECSVGVEQHGKCHLTGKRRHYHLSKRKYATILHHLCHNNIDDVVLLLLCRFCQPSYTHQPSSKPTKTNDNDVYASS